MTTVTRIEPMSLGRIFGILYAAIGLIYGVLFGMFGAFIAAVGGAEAAGFGAFGFVGVIVFPIVFGLSGLIGGVIMALLYNVVAGRFGGIQVETDRDSDRPLL